ncbi:MAG: TRM11 family SAM-dependent methyltransferase [Promethearchaeota archaeon]
MKEKFGFILGKNWRLSIAELIQTFEQSFYGLNGKIVDYSACSAIVEFVDSKINEKKLANLQFKLGGTQKICKIIDFIEINILTKAFPQVMRLPPGEVQRSREYIEGIISDSVYRIFGKIKNQKYFVANSIYPEEFSSEYYKTLLNYFLPFVNKTWQKVLKEKGAKSVIYYVYPEEQIKNGTLNPIYPHHFYKYELYKPERKEIVYILTEEGLYLGYTLQATDANQMKMIDEQRPYIEPAGSIPPKFAKIMINFLGLKPPYNNQKILDPFCGAGTILLFAYIQNINVYGSDKKEESIKWTRSNIKWVQKFLERPLKVDLNKQIKQADIKELAEVFKGIKFNGIVTEPILLPYFKELPKYNEIRKVIEESVLPLYQSAFREFKKILKPGARVVITVPNVQTLDGGRIKIPIKDMVLKEGYQQVNLIDRQAVAEKSSRRLRLNLNRSFGLDKSSKYLYREFFIFKYEEKT